MVCKKCWIWYWCIYTKFLHFILFVCTSYWSKETFICTTSHHITCYNATDVTTHVWQVRIADSISLFAQVISKDPVNINTKKSIQVLILCIQMQFCPNSLLWLNRLVGIWHALWLQQNHFFSYRCVYLGRELGSIFPTITPKCLAQLAVCVIVEVLVYIRRNTL